MAIDDSTIRQTLRNFVRSKCRRGDAAAITDQTLIIEEGLISSVDVLELIFLIESLSEIEIDATELEPDMLQSIDSIHVAFFE